MFSRSTIASLIPAVAVATAGIGAIAPAQAATTSVTASTAGTKDINLTTYMWGTSNAPVGTTVCSQVNLSGTWATSQCSTIKADHTYAVPLTYGASTSGTYSFRAITRNASGVVTATSSPASLTRTYQGGVLGTPYTLYTGYNGVKVYLARKALGLSYGPTNATVDTAMTNAVVAFQKRHGLPATGVLDERTWNVLNPRDTHGVRYPFNIDSWTKTADVMADAPRDVKVAAMIKFAQAQLGKPYIWGGTGPVGFDCSGLLLQAARAGGMKPANVSNFTDIRTASDLSNQMWLDTITNKNPKREFQQGSLNNLHLGDFIYYANASGTVHHVSMYVGSIPGVNGGALSVLNAVGSKVQYSYLSDNFGWTKIGVNRAFSL